jgi:4''''-phosphopantetheinyl transferase
MTHCRGLRAAAVAFAHDADAIGIDAEPDEPLPDGVIDIVASPAERRRLRALPVRGVSWDRLLFSAKESVYKAWYPRERSWLGFEDADVALGDGVLTAEIHGESGLRFTLTGYWGVSDGILVTAVVVPAGKWPAGT